MKHFVLGIVICKNKNKILLHGYDELQAWNGPGGKVEDGETPYAAMCRESMEEVGFCGQYEHKITVFRKNCTLHVYFCKYLLLVPPKKPFEWIDIEDIQSDLLVMPDLLWIVPLCQQPELSFPILLSEKL